MPDRTALLDDIRRMDERLDRTPRAVDVLHASAYDRAAFREIFDTWRSAVAAALDGESVDPTREELLARIIELHTTVEADPSIQTWRDRTLYAPRAVYDCESFDGWTDAKQQAGILIGHRTLFREETTG